MFRPQTAKHVAFSFNTYCCVWRLLFLQLQMFLHHVYITPKKRVNIITTAPSVTVLNNLKKISALHRLIYVFSLLQIPVIYKWEH
jgi:hypothetical protein